MISPRLYILVSFIACCLILTSCFEVIEDITINNDGSGRSKYLINGSQSKTKLNGLFMVDSLAKNQMPSKDELQAKAEKMVAELKIQRGISNVVFKSDWNQYIFEISFHFSSTKDLNAALFHLQKSNNPENKAIQKEIVQFDGTTLKRLRAPEVSQEDKEKIEGEINKNSDLFRRAKFISIFRFEKEITEVSNPEYKLSSTRKAAMMQTSFYHLTKEKHLENTITLKK